jgi:hypothetical protein
MGITWAPWRNQYSPGCKTIKVSSEKVKEWRFIALADSYIPVGLEKSVQLHFIEKWDSALRRLTLLISVLIIALVVTVSPQFLIVAENPIKSDAVVVLLGPVMEERMQQAKKLVQDGWSEYLIVPAALKSYRRNENIELVPIDTSISVPVKPERPTEAGRPFQHFEDTHVEILRARAILQNMGLKSITFVSSPYHMRRIKIISKRVFKGWNSPMAYVTTPIDRKSALLWWMDRLDRWWVTHEYFKIAWFLIYEPFV